MRLVFVAAAAALGFSACGQSEPAADTASATDAAPAAPATPAVSTAMPEGPSAGKWRMTMTAMGQSLPPTEQCYQKQVSLEEAEKMQQQAGVSCSEQSYKKEGDTWVGHSVCTMEMGPGGPIKVSTNTRVTGDFASKYTMEMNSKMDPAPMPSMAEQTMTLTAERIGDC